ncbi:signal recognition particle receptor subunit beta-like isoform X1 [Gossypium australe]|uniref:Signal recognition particle receptor subunit beta-like isoform X1 n=1 Tax=Gossypium australe TaxID=47621 RepID=A0A5B6UEY8_9ROSI|nr:signal recognition particle receptor subunit beta-like isoform X1 [Gossypium australe]
MIIPSLRTYSEASVSNVASEPQNTLIDHRHCLLLNPIANIWNFLCTGANGIFVKRAMANETGFVYVTPHVVNNKCK